MDTTGMKLLTDAEMMVLATAEAESGSKGLTLETKLTEVFRDSLEYISFINALNIDDYTASNAETLGDLANALAVSN